MANPAADGGLENQKLRLELVERSFRSVVALTEYQDTKAARVLTAVAFLSSFAAAAFRWFLDSHLFTIADLTCSLGAVLAIVLMVVFSLLIVGGAFCVIWGILPRFNIPGRWQSKPGNPGSRLFFEKIVEAGSDHWQQYFEKDTSALLNDYVKDYVRESYLVAEKVNKKLKWLQPGTRMLLWAVFIFGVWIITVVGLALG